MQLNTTRDVVTYLSKYVHGKTVDYGAGSAKYKNIIRTRSTEYVAFDIVPGGKIDVVGDATHPPFANDSFDTVICNQVLEHVEQPWNVMREIKRILNSNGICIVTVPFLVPYHPCPKDFFRFTKEGLESLCREEGLIILESGTYGNTPSVLAEMLHFAHFYKYENFFEKRGRWGDRFIRLIKKVAFLFDGIFKNKAVYVNSFVAAKKP